MTDFTTLTDEQLLHKHQTLNQRLDDEQDSLDFDDYMKLMSEAEAIEKIIIDKNLF